MQTMSSLLVFITFSCLLLIRIIPYSSKAYYSFGGFREYFYEDDYFGTGSLVVHLKSNSNATVDVPLSIAYSEAKDGDLRIINDLIESCRANHSLRIYFTATFDQRIISFLTISNNDDAKNITYIDCPFKVSVQASRYGPDD